jgi:hypothetical protein
MAQHAERDARVMVNDAPSFYYHSGRESLSIPNEPVDVVAEVMDRYGATYLLLGDEYPLLAGLYRAPESDLRFLPLHTFGEDEGRLVLFRRVRATDEGA